MSFERFGSSDIYIYEHVGGFIECCGCSLANLEEDEIFGFTHLNTPREALKHLDDHEAAGENIGGARASIEEEYEDLDAPIQPYIEDPEVTAKRRDKFQKIFESDTVFPPENFRDVGNGE